MRKDIYIIKNDINKKVYIGQAKNAKTRFQGHCKPSSANNEIIGRAINKYGREHFWYEILEHNVENYNEREKYWIKKYNCIVPNGYNLSNGGEEPPVMKGLEHPESKLTQEQLDNLIYDLKNTNLSYPKLSEKYGIPHSTVGSINYGKSYRIDNIIYPIREKQNRPGKLGDEEVNEIIKLLQTTYDSYEDIGKMFDVEARAIARINKGYFHKQENIKYPIRNFRNIKNKPLLTYEQVTEVIDLLINTKLSLTKIAKKFDVPINIIIGIKSGNTKLYRREGYTYPLRSNN